MFVVTRFDVAITSIGATEQGMQEPNAVGDRQHRPEHHSDERDRAGGTDFGIEERNQRLLLGDEAEQRNHSGHRERGGTESRHHERSSMPSRTDLGDVARAEFVIDHTDTEEKCDLEHRMGQEMGHPCIQRCRPTQSDQHRQESELRHRAVSEQQLGIGLTEGAPATDQHRGNTRQNDPPAPQVRLPEHW